MDLTLDEFSKWMTILNKKINTHIEYLNRLGDNFNDPECGNKLLHALNQITNYLNCNDDYNLTSALNQTSIIFSNENNPLCSLLGTAFLQMSKRSVDTREIGELLNAATLSIPDNNKMMKDIWLLLTNTVKNNELSPKVINETIKNVSDQKNQISDYLNQEKLNLICPNVIVSGYIFLSLFETEEA
nr:hypothetical protein [uncultured Ligilactobacillus sp.]